MSKLLNASSGYNKFPRLKIVRNKEQFFGVLFALPAILGFLIFFLGPMIASLFYSFTDYALFNKPKFIGFQNYKDLFSGTDPFFYKSLFVTFYYVILNVPASIIFSFFLALLLNNEIKGRPFFRAIFYLPSIVPTVASAMIWMWLLNPDLGLVNNILTALHLPTSQWLFAENTVIPSVVLTGLWTTGGTMVIFLAGLSGIPNVYYEAVEIDGGNSIHKFFNVTLPMVSPTIFFNTIMAIISSFQVFTQAYILTQGGPNNASLFYVFLLWREGFRNTRMGYASALAWVLFIIILIFTFFTFRSTNSLVYYEGERKNS